MFYLLNSRRKFQYWESPKSIKITPPNYVKILVTSLGSLDNLKLCMNMCTSLTCASNFVVNSDLRLHTIITCKLFSPFKMLCNFLKNGFPLPPFPFYTFFFFFPHFFQSFIPHFSFIFTLCHFSLQSYVA